MSKWIYLSGLVLLLLLGIGLMVLFYVNRCKAKCNDTCYNPKLQKCVDGEVVDLKFCGNRIYDPDIECCINNVITTEKCNNVCFDKNSKCCINNQIVDCPVQPKCGDVEFDPNTQCCINNVITTDRCNNVCYDKNSKCCINNQIVDCPVQSKCGDIEYDPNTQQCCKGKVIAKSELCCPDLMCGSKCLDSKTQLCENGEVIDLALCTKNQSNISYYDPRVKCCGWTGVEECQKDCKTENLNETYKNFLIESEDAKNRYIEFRSYFDNNLDDYVNNYAPMVDYYRRDYIMSKGGFISKCNNNNYCMTENGFKLPEKDEKCLEETCGPFAYDKEKYTCCGGLLIKGKINDCDTMDNMCKGVKYDPTKQRCCRKNGLIEKGKLCERE